MPKHLNPSIHYNCDELLSSSSIRVQSSEGERYVLPCSIICRRLSIVYESSKMRYGRLGKQLPLKLLVRWELWSLVLLTLNPLTHHETGCTERSGSQLLVLLNQRTSKRCSSEQLHEKTREGGSEKKLSLTLIVYAGRDGQPHLNVRFQLLQRHSFVPLQNAEHEREVVEDSLI